jgi:type VI secretion system protein ImpG
MDEDDKLYRDFLEEMSALENFRMAYAGEHPSVPIEREDPDVRRLMETVAFFAARARRAGRRSLDALHRRMVRQFLPYLLAPTPAIGVVQAVPTGKFVEPVTLPCGTEMALAATSDRVALFRTLRDLRILPVALGRVDLLLREQGGYRLLVPVVASFARNDDVGPLSLHVNYLNDFRASLRVVTALRRHLLKAQVTFEARVDETTDGAPCTLRFGFTEADAAWANPIERERMHFQCPAATDLFVTVDVPPPPRNWSQFTLCLDLDPGWPRNLRLTAEMLSLFATPVVNLQHCMAQPIVHDGTKEQWPIRHPTPAARFELHSVRGVYRAEADSLTPLRPGVLAGGFGVYEIDEDPRLPGGRAAVLGLRLPEAFAAPWTVAVDADWLQPWFSELLRQKLRIAPYRQIVPGVDWETVGDLVPHRESAGDGMSTFVQVLGLQHKSLLAQDDILALLGVLGTVWTGPYAAVRDLIADVAVREVPLAQPGGTSGVKLVYTVRFREHEPGLAPLIDNFLVHLERVLDAWVAAAPVEVRLGEPA